MNQFTYIGYGCIVSAKNKSEVDITTSKAYKALKSAFLEDFTIDVLPANSIDRPGLEELLWKIVKTSNTGSKTVPHSDVAIVVPTLETLGGASDIVVKNYAAVLEDFHIIILNHPELSTCTLDGIELVDLNDKKAITRLCDEVSRVKTVVHGRKSLPLGAKFRQIFWAWQNYFIDTNDAIALFGGSRASLYSMSREFITSVEYRELYEKEYCYLTNPEDKPIRGIVLDDDTNKILIKMQRSMGENWTLDGVKMVLCDEPVEIIKYAPADYLRLRLNYKEGRAAMVAATKKYSKGKDFLLTLQSEF